MIYDLFLNKYFWDLTSAALFFTPVRNVTMFSEVSQEHLRGEVRWASY